MLSNAYFLAKFRFDTAENEPAKNLQNFANFPIFPAVRPAGQSLRPADGLVRAGEARRVQAREPMPVLAGFGAQLKAAELAAVMSGIGERTNIRRGQQRVHF